ncbi:VanZ family protein [Bradyrhizobium diazoefficiens]|uniref:Antibiotic resistance protein VanZ n=1 Tax=Bradyrhizobium diazoefficiens TaxID=1355477 RepID=A0A810A6Y3_9BRAD|nr:VanZ family protein [Bradyrhizobium diazoefficiens]BBZ97151.1 antibiotic resistance protein VanZ [Bradyrhizobium diazoefficiens]BCA14837.1 antibiotic resistance protein VanZ [Bradyrhizobium diazoefficiens]BCE59250.1 antibiotic resistance protein VanZ [Bradyrhizobium diazoefficiens]BCE67931.1 antibiotic resistance protein VanZ [Bradyrhizobium diazoefficiens]
MVRTALLRLVAWLLAAAVTFVTLGPEDVRPHPVLGQQGDHALAFLLVGILFSLAYPQRRWTVSAVAVALIGLLEIMQLWVPGRHARFADFVVGKQGIRAAPGRFLQDVRELPMRPPSTHEVSAMAAVWPMRIRGIAPRS